MLNALIARYLVAALEPMLDRPDEHRVISRLAGLVKTLETDAFTKGKVNRFPIPVDSSFDDCASSDSSFPDLAPTDRERLIIYFEDFGSTATEPTGRKWQSRLRLIGWGNSDLLVTDRPPEMTGALLIAMIVGRLRMPIPIPAGDPVKSLTCAVVGSPVASANLFEKYTYSETRSQYLLSPYFAFGLDLQLTYSLTDDCTISLTGLPATERC